MLTCVTEAAEKDLRLLIWPDIKKMLKSELLQRSYLTL